MIDAVFSLSLAELRAVDTRLDPFVNYVSFERRGPWLVVEVSRVVEAPFGAPRREVYSRHEETGEVVYDMGDEL